MVIEVTELREQSRSNRRRLRVFFEHASTFPVDGDHLREAFAEARACCAGVTVGDHALVQPSHGREDAWTASRTPASGRGSGRTGER